MKDKLQAVNSKFLLFFLFLCRFLSFLSSRNDFASAISWATLMGNIYPLRQSELDKFTDVITFNSLKPKRLIKALIGWLELLFTSY